MTVPKNSRLRFNFGFLLEAGLGTSRIIELDYPKIHVEDDVVLTPLKGSFQAVRNSKGIYVTGEMQTTTKVECARCLEQIDHHTTFRLDDLFYYPPHTTPPGEFSVGEDGFIDLAPLVRQLSILEIPMQLYCREDCQGLCIECGQNLNEAECGCEVSDIDPRFAELKKLLDP